MKWISVEDELPKDDESVLMCEVNQEGMPVIGWYECEVEIPGFYPANTLTNIRMHVTHWMPLPKLPKEK